MIGMQAKDGANKSWTTNGPAMTSCVIFGKLNSVLCFFMNKIGNSHYAYLKGMFSE